MKTAVVFVGGGNNNFYALNATTGTVMIAVLPLIVGVQLLLQALVIDIGHTPARPIAAGRRRFTTAAPN